MTGGGGGSKKIFLLMTSCIKEAWLVGGASTHRRFRHLYSSERSSHFGTFVTLWNVRHTSELVDYCPICLGGEHTCVHGAVKQLARRKSLLMLCQY